jgi:hypothetical protein
MCCPASIAAIAGAAISAVGAGVSANMSRIQAGQQQQAQADAVKAAGTAQKGTAADTSQLNAGGQPASAGVNSGPASTLLTGSGGIANSALNLGGGGLGSNNLLGQ